MVNGTGTGDVSNHDERALAMESHAARAKGPTGERLLQE